jgi:high-affinity iron transporter
VLPTFVIGLREGVEAALIIGIIAAFLSSQGRRDALRYVWLGVGLAVVLCLAVGIALQVASSELPQRQQEKLETVVALVAVGMVTYMIVWMRQHSRQLKGSIETGVAHALAEGSVKALVVMAFLAVLREGLETAVFLLAVFQNSRDTAASASGALLGLAVAVVVGYLLYKGGLRINLARFFKFTGVVLVLVAAGLVASAAHSAHEAAWLTSMQTQVFDLRWLISPGSVQSAIAAGMFGIQPQPVVAEVVTWLLYAVPVMAFVLWPARRPIPTPAPGRPDSLPSRAAVGTS